MPTMERIPISEWEQQAAKPSHTTPSNNAALAITKFDDNDDIAPTVSECRSDIDSPTTDKPDADDTLDDTNASAASYPVANTLRSTTTSSSDDADEEDSDEEIGAAYLGQINHVMAQASLNNDVHPFT